MSKLYMGVEIGGTKQQILVVDENGNIVDKIADRFPLKNGAQDVLDWLLVKVPVMLEKHKIERIGVGFGGPLESATGRVLISVQVQGWKDFELKTWFEKQFNMPTIVVNDTVCGGYAELCMGAGRGSRSFFYTNIGTGIGGSFYMGGRTFDGLGNGGCYFGNTFAADWTADAAGKIEKIENLCSGTAIERRLRAEGYVPADSMMMEMCRGDVAKLSCKDLKNAAEAGDAFALAELDRVGYTFGQGLATVVSMMSPDRIAIGGGVGNMGEVLFRPIRKYADEYVFISGKDTYEIVGGELIEDNVPIGAALYARDGFDVI
ncbi:MAG: ROK family protein [Christensenellaceae bacterium]|nr:ROK family protein [Christensenellaceae bacterium]